MVILFHILRQNKLELTIAVMLMLHMVIDVEPENGWVYNPHVFNGNATGAILLPQSALTYKKGGR